MSLQLRKHTVAELEAFEKLPENRARLWELVNGEIREKVPTQKHGMIAFLLNGAFFVYFQQHPQAGRGAVEVRHKMPDDEHNALIPDVCIYTNTTATPIEEGAVPYMPDLAIEIQSPDDSVPQMRAKAQYYLENGSRLVWLIYRKREVDVCTWENNAMVIKTVDINGTLDGGTVLPDFALPVKAIFP